jgi:hypothetical protein
MEVGDIQGNSRSHVNSIKEASTVTPATEHSHTTYKNVDNDMVFPHTKKTLVTV